MGKFKKIGKSETIVSQDRKIKIEIFRFKKIGTSSIFFAPEYKGMRLTRTMFARLYDARSLARAYINFKKAQ